MFIDDLPTAPRYDAVIVGAGPAGVSCAMALAAARRRVLILESGGRQAVAGDHSVGYGHFSGGYWNQHWVRGPGRHLAGLDRLVHDSDAARFRQPRDRDPVADRLRVDDAVLAPRRPHPRSPRGVRRLPGAVRPRVPVSPGADDGADALRREVRARAAGLGGDRRAARSSDRRAGGQRRAVGADLADAGAARRRHDTPRRDPGAAGGDRRRRAGQRAAADAAARATARSASATRAGWSAAT